MASGPGAARQGVLVMSVWTEPDTPRLPRARITSLTDLAAGSPATSAAAGEASIVAALRCWLAELTAPDETPPG